jgi:hypothetical protein
MTVPAGQVPIPLGEVVSMFVTNETLVAALALIGLTVAGQAVLLLVDLIRGRSE